MTPLESLDGASNGARGLISNRVNEQGIRLMGIAGLGKIGKRKGGVLR